MRDNYFNNIKRILLILLFCVFLPSYGLHAEDEKKNTNKPQKVQKAKLALLEFNNISKSKNYKWLSSSLSDAINKSMEETFIYDCPNVKKNQKIAKKILKKICTRKVKNLLQYTNETKVEYVVYGSYEIPKRKKAKVTKAVIHAGIFYGKKLAILEEIHAEVPLNNKLFENTEKLAKQFVQSILDYVKKQEEQISEVKKEVKEEEQAPRLIIKENIKKESSIKISSNVSYSGMLWRNAIFPGWGHLYANQSRSYFYMAMTVLSGAAFAYFHFDYSSKQSDYDNAKTGFNAKYDAANQAALFRSIASFTLAAVYLASLTDIFITGGGYIKSVQKEVDNNNDVQFSFTTYTNNLYSYAIDQAKSRGLYHGKEDIVTNMQVKDDY